MLADLFPRYHRRFTSLPLLGSIVDDFAAWLFHSGYPRARVRRHVRATRSVDRALRRRGPKRLDQIRPEDLRACLPARAHDDPEVAATVRCLERFLAEHGIVVSPPERPTHSGSVLTAYRDFLCGVRGFSPGTVRSHLRTASEFLEHIDYETTPGCIRHLSTVHLDEFLTAVGKRHSRATLQHVVAHLRGFLRCLAARGDIRPGLDTEIDTPRVYRLEQLPRALSWETVQKFLDAIDRRSSIGRRDYAMFLLVATYGLRASEVVALKLDDVEWRARRIRIPKRKGGTPLLLPLTDDVGGALVDYLRRGRPQLSCREVLLRCRAPAGVLKPTAVSEAFQNWVKRGALEIPFQGPHCMRHSYAVHLLRQGVSLKTIGDVLGHRSAEATCVYLRLAVEDLRDVALPLPNEMSISPAVRP
jgi:integrase/recombinase XerD